MSVVVTHCNEYFVSRVCALVESLQNSNEIRSVLVFAHNQNTSNLLKSYLGSRAEIIEIEELIKKFPELGILQNSKTHKEFLFAITPFLLKFVHLKYSNLNAWYIDADIYFFDSFSKLHHQVRSNSFTVTSHNFPRHLRHLEIYGKYNVGIISSAGDDRAMEILNWWGDKCLEDSSIFKSPEVYGDQKYLDEFENNSNGFYTFENITDNAAPWNLNELDTPPVSFHFSGLRRFRNFSYIGFSMYSWRPSKKLMRKVYIPYLRTLDSIEATIYGKRQVDTRTLSNRALLKMVLYWDFKLQLF
jgi:hypothetical protein